MLIHKQLWYETGPGSASQGGGSQPVTEPDDTGAEQKCA